MQDSIERHISVKAAPERVYQAITDPKQITNWFPDSIEGTLAVGERSTLVFNGHEHRAQIYVEAARPSTYFSYRWVPGGQTAAGDVLEQPNTLVEFIIEQDGAGSKITVKESGFASLPAEVAEASFKDNSGGWEYMMGRLEQAMNAA